MPGYKRYGCPCCRPSSSSATSSSSVTLSSVSVSSVSSQSSVSSSSSASTNCCDLLSSTLYALVQVQLYPNGMSCIRPPNGGVRCFVFDLTEITEAQYNSEAGTGDCCADVYRRIWKGSFSEICLTCNDGLGLSDSQQKCEFTGSLYYHCCCEMDGGENNACDVGSDQFLEIVPAATPLKLGATTNCCFPAAQNFCDDTICWLKPACDTSGHCGTSNGVECWIDDGCCSPNDCCNGEVGSSCIRIGPFSEKPIDGGGNAICDSNTGNCGCIGGVSPMIASAIDARTGRPLIDIVRDMGYV